MVKTPGMSSAVEQTTLDLSYNTRYAGVELPDAYPRLIWDVLKGDHSQFVRADELEYAWRIFTPLLNHIDSEKVHNDAMHTLCAWWARAGGRGVGGLAWDKGDCR